MKKLYGQFEETSHQIKIAENQEAIQKLEKKKKVGGALA